jgi:hypothetical protein
MTADVGGRLSPETPDIASLVSAIDRGEIKVPQFQRRFVWSEGDALDLLDSIANNYPIGSLLLWKTNDKLAVDRNIGEFQLPETDDLTPTDYVLDGQQRLTVIYSCLGADPKAEGFAASYNLVDEEFVATPNEAHVHMFPLRLIYRTTDLLNFRTALQTHQDAASLQERLDHLVSVLTRYKVPVVILKDLTVEEVCPIFERINSSGTRLSTYDLMVAATWSTNFDLNEKVDEISLTLAPKNYDDISGDTVLKCLSAIKFASTKREDMLKLRELDSGEMDELVAKTKDALLKAVDLLSTEFGVYSLDFLPYEVHLVALTFIFERAKNLNHEQVARVREWFWRTAFNERYRGASEFFVSRDLAAIEAYVVNGHEDADQFGVAPSEATINRLTFRKNNSRSRAFVLGMAKLGPRNVTNGAVIDVADALSAYNKKQFHHVFPQAYLKRLDPELERNFLLNFVMLAASENNDISDADPTTYLPKCIEALEERAEDVFTSNLLPKPREFDYAAGTYDEFRTARAPLVFALVSELCAGKR